ncbi:MAG: leucyl aminopeptidase [candidate division Zixibacteria bacterium HGW-Zixibacteria-1]|nr:MAG: leucyl aminopeptidase [candidate division Zixibacteria bacterium HGW-Zixibacteria-1]
MKISFSVSDFVAAKGNVLVKFCHQDGFAEDKLLRIINEKLKNGLKNIFDSGEFEGKLNQTIVLHAVPGIKAERVVLAGLGKKDKVNHDSYRQAAGTLSRIPAVKKAKSVAFYFGDGEDGKIATAVVEGFLLGRFEINDYKTGNDDGDDKLETIFFHGTDQNQVKLFKKAVTAGQIIAEGVILARRLASMPGNSLPPEKFASEARTQAGRHKIKITVLNEKQIKTEKMGALLAVAQGSAEPPRFVIMEYKGGKASQKPIVIIGKGVTFDSGGISLKPVQDMHKMKGDMQGGAIILGTMVTIARLGLPLNVVGLIPLAENMPSSRALKPGDIITSRKGKTIEIISTDAEGRLILADALDYANKFKPQAVIDIATLTGGALYVLGYSGAPIMGNDTQLMAALKKASEATAERVWEMPIWDDFRDRMKSPIADLKNSGGKPAATMTAGAFLESFTGDWPWAHIDVASVDDELTGKPYIPVGASGTGLRLLVALLEQW